MALEEIFTSYPLYIAIFCIYLSGVIASAGGIGGGGVVMPLLLVIGKFPIHKAVILSQCAVFGNNLAQSFINFSRSHPYDVHRPLIYYDIVMVILPSQLGGSFIGVIISKIFPETVLIILAIVTLLYAIYRTFKKAMIYYRSENEVYATNQTMYEKLLQKSIHSPTKIGRKTVYSEQVSIFDEEDGDRLGDNFDDEEEEDDDGFGRLIESAIIEDVIDDINIDDETAETERLVHATTVARTHYASKGTPSQQRSTGKTSNNSHHHSRSLGVSGHTQNVSSVIISGGDSSTHSDSQSASYSHRVDSSEFFRDSTGSSPNIGEHRHRLSSGGNGPIDISHVEHGGLSEEDIRGVDGNDPRNTREFRESEDTVLFNPLTFSLTTSKNVANALLISSLPPQFGEESNAEGKKANRRRNKKRDSVGSGQSSGESDGDDSRSSHSSSGRRSLTGGNVTMVGGVPTGPNNGAVPGTGSNPTLRILPRFQLMVIGTIWALYCGLYVIMKYTTEDCTMRYWFEMGSIYPILIGTVVYTINYLRYYQHNLPPAGMATSSSSAMVSLRILQGDIDFAKASWAIPICGFIVGILTSLLGIGGGELLGPLFLAYHMLPQVSTATTSMMSLLNSANNIVHYAILEELTYSLAGTFVLVGILSGTTGRQAALYFSHKYGRVSFLVFMLTAILCLSVLLLVYESSTKEFDFNLHELCE